MPEPKAVTIEVPDDGELYQAAARLGAGLQARGWRLALAESCTGGWIAKALTDVPGSSAWLEGSVVSYSNAAKQRLLGVPAAVLARHGAVSEPVVRAMADGALRRFEADLALAVSGIAGPGGAVAGKPVGTVWLGWSRRDRDGGALCLRLAGDREAVRRASVAAALLRLQTETDDA